MEWQSMYLTWSVLMPSLVHKLVAGFWEIKSFMCLSLCYVFFPRQSTMENVTIVLFLGIVNENMKWNTSKNCEIYTLHFTNKLKVNVCRRSEEQNWFQPEIHLVNLSHFWSMRGECMRQYRYSVVISDPGSWWLRDHAQSTACPFQGSVGSHAVQGIACEILSEGNHFIWGTAPPLNAWLSHSLVVPRA